jgi:hypothetical protein
MRMWMMVSAGLLALVTSGCSSPETTKLTEPPFITVTTQPPNVGDAKIVLSDTTTPATMIVTSPSSQARLKRG